MNSRILESGDGFLREVKSCALLENTVSGRNHLRCLRNDLLGDRRGLASSRSLSYALAHTSLRDAHTESICLWVTFPNDCISGRGIVL